VYLSKALFRYIDHIAVLIALLFCHCVNLALVALYGDGPEFDIDSVQSLLRNWLGWSIIMGEALIAWQIVEIVSPHSK
jgi:hypothetical protein